MILYTLNYVKCSRIAMMVLFSDLLFQTKAWWAGAEAEDVQVIWKKNSFNFLIQELVSFQLMRDHSHQKLVQVD